MRRAHLIDPHQGADIPEIVRIEEWDGRGGLWNPTGRSGTQAPIHHTPWLEAMDDAMEASPARGR